MKILAIRGKNLASLAGEFEVDFRREPLAGAGLFAICGPTGAGKSTLLDALCLALYNRTPRLAGVFGLGVELPDGQGAALGQQDPRSLLRRGCVEGHAEAEFVGTDGAGYRARWSVWRANHKAGGKLQAVDMSLVRLPDGQPIGARKSEVLPEIERRVGLNFQQFTRAVLLAQNEFAAFLKAADDERSKLLETLTGTHIYSLISKQAHERDKAEQAALNGLRARLEGRKPLDAEARAALESEREAAVASAADLDARRETLEAHLRWHAEWEAARDGETAALADAQTADARHAEAEPRRRRLARIALVRPGEAKWRDAQATARAVEDSREALAGCERDAALAEQSRQAAETALARAREASHQAQEAQRAAAPDLDRAKRLDGEIAGTVQIHGERARELAAAEQAGEEARRRQAELRQEQENIQKDRETAAAWLEQQAATGALVEAWPRWDALLGQADAAEREAVAAQAKQADRADELQKRQKARDAAVSARLREERAAADAEAGYAEAERGCAGYDGLALASERRAVETRRDSLRRAEQLWRDCGEAGSRRAEAQAKLEQLDAERLAAEAELAQIAHEKPQAEARAHQAEQSLDAAKLACAENVEQLRDGLAPGRPCPVCGSEAHPYAEGVSGLRAVLQALTGEAAQHRQAFQALLDRESGQRARRELATRQAAELQPQLARALAECARLESAWAAEPMAAELVAVAEAERPAWFAAHLSEANQYWEAVQAREEAGRQALAARDAARQRHAAARESWQAAQNQETAAEAAWATVSAALAQAEETLAQAARRRDGLLAELSGVLPESGWQEIWRRDPAAFRDKLRRRVEIYRDKQRQLAGLEQCLAQLAIAGQSQATAVERAAAQLDQAGASFRLVDARLGEQRGERGRLFAGRPAVEVERELRQAVAEAQATEQQAAMAADQARAQAVAAETRRDATGTRLAEQQQAADHAAAALAAWLADCNARAPSEPPLDGAELAELLAHDAAWIEAERQAVQAFADALNQARAVLDERRRQREAVERRRATEATAEALREGRAALAGEIQAVDARRMDLGAKLRADDERRAESLALQAELEKQEDGARLWGQLNQLIGSHDGKKFRNFAQQLTLDVLLGYANRHLAELSRRYRLRRVPDAQARHTLALMVVDRDMGDETRSVHSLSGGESFLVSLALALGLAELSANRVRVESLFIDEGFGSLDSDTLRVAMDALDCLHAQGRKVGVISHVQEMTERIGTRVQVKRLAGGRSKVVVG